MGSNADRVSKLSLTDLRAMARELGVEGKTAADLRAGVTARLDAQSQEREEPEPVDAAPPPAPELPRSEVVELTPDLQASMPTLVAPGRRLAPQFIRVRGRLIERK